MVISLSAQPSEDCAWIVAERDQSKLETGTEAWRDLLYCLVGTRDTTVGRAIPEILLSSRIYFSNNPSPRDHIVVPIIDNQTLPSIRIIAVLVNLNAKQYTFSCTWFL